MLYHASDHEPLNKISWSEAHAKETIFNIVTACLAEFQNENLWPVHPDLQAYYNIKKPLTNLWIGAAGTIWALNILKLNNTELPAYDFKPYLKLLISKQAASLSEFPSFLDLDPHAPGYLLGYIGEDLVRWQFTQDPDVLEKIYQDIQNNFSNPAEEIMWGNPGSLLAAWFVYQKTQDPKWAKLFQNLAAKIFASWQEDKDHNCYIWQQDMYKTKLKYLGLVHGFAGNVSALLQGFELLSAQQKTFLIEQAQKTFIKTAQTNQHHANWLACLGQSFPGGDKYFLQLCHGAPGMIIGLAKLWPHMQTETREVFLKGATLIWDAGPLKKPWGLCHGTAGNGYAFLTCYRLTQDPIWLERARAFAMHAIEQFKVMQKQFGCIRTDNWCGDIGLALYLKDCINETADFPMLDTF